MNMGLCYTLSTMHLRLDCNIRTSVTLKKSEFITLLFRVFEYDEIQTLIKATRKEHPKASHVCVAYRIHDREQSNDDGEPSGTAGLPMLEVLRQNNVSDILALVVRYYGGIPLGASGLTRAYRSCVADTLKKAQLNELVLVHEIEVEVELSLADLLLSRFPEWGKLIRKQFSQTFLLTFQTSDEDIEKKLMALSKGQALIHRHDTLWVEEKRT